MNDFQINGEEAQEISDYIFLDSRRYDSHSREE